MLGSFEFIIIIAIIIVIIDIVSLAENIGLNFTLSRFDIEFVGFDDPFSCNRIKCAITIAEIIIGIMKCSEKNRFNVGWEIEGPPQIQLTMSFPTIGIAESTPVITVAPQNDIWPHGNTYPRNAVAMDISSRAIPDIQTFLLFWAEEKYIPRAV